MIDVESYDGWENALTVVDEARPPSRVFRAGEAFWEPGGDVIHYSNANNRDDIACRFAATMLCVPGQPMLTLVDDAADRTCTPARTR